MKAVGGVRLGWDQLPPDLQAWVSLHLGPITGAESQVGGMSPGCALRLTGAHGRAFLKACSADVNADTTALFRYEQRVLAALPPVPYRASLLASYEATPWVALLLEDVEGRHPDLSYDADYPAVRDVVAAQGAELAVAPAVELVAMDTWSTRWTERWDLMAEDPHGYLPAWAADGYDDLRARVAALPAHLEGPALCHWDLREDNLLMRPDGQVVVVDWGMSRKAPAWMDPFVLAIHHVRSPLFDDLVAGLADPEVITAVLLAIAGSQSWGAQQPVPPSLPTLTQFRIDDAARLLAGARRRLEGRGVQEGHDG